MAKQGGEKSKADAAAEMSLTIGDHLKRLELKTADGDVLGVMTATAPNVIEVQLYGSAAKVSSFRPKFNGDFFIQLTLRQGKDK
jgi:hypothetical protein